ncbi:hypothetical protein DPV78_008279 [Talaromyces pinophilus]|jgi:hypothetical protein|nr:hypothetical protein DPV78_008279 [Talaromyces pinophilus]
MEETQWPPLACADRLAEQSARVFMLLLDDEWIVKTLKWLGIQSPSQTNQKLQATSELPTMIR